MKRHNTKWLLSLHIYMLNSSLLQQRETLMHRKSNGKDTQPEIIRLRVIGQDNSVHAAEMYPFALSETKVSGSVNWSCSPMNQTIIRAESEYVSMWGQRLLLVWALAGPHSTRQSSFTAPGMWTQAELVLADLMGSVGDTVKLTINTARWDIDMKVSGQPDINMRTKVPVSFRNQDVGTCLAEMTSQLLLGHTWQTNAFVTN